ncbi:MAG: Gfo/Idh/MocA family oxidoreductase, partial [Dehalococcoidia bacterium]
LLIVGAGTMGSAQARLVASGRVPGLELAGVMDLDGVRALDLANNVSTTAFGDMARAVAESKPDLAYVATPDALHRAPVEALARAGVAFLVEKPLATTVEDAEAMVQAVNAAGIYAEVNYSNRWNPPFVEAMRAIDAGEIGEVRSFNARLNNPISSPRDRLAWSAGTTPAWFLMSHCLDLALWLGGMKAETVYASGGRGTLAEAGINTWDWIHAVVRYAGGGDGVFESLWMLPEAWPGQVEFNFRVVGTVGALDVDTSQQGITLVGDRYRHPPTLLWAPQRTTAFLRAMEGSGRTRVSLADGLETTRILVAIHKSLETGAVERI